MKKQTLLLAALFSSVFTLAQVGVNTQTPQATLDITGKPADTSSLDGVIAPRMTGAELRAKTYTSAQTGALVYITLADTAPAGQTIDVTSTGYFYFDGTKWIKTGGANVNIYNANGSLTSTRTLMLNGFQLNFTGVLRNTYWDVDGRIHQQTNTASTDAVMGFHGGGANLWLQQWYNANAAISADGNSTGLSLATRYTNISAPITLSTTPGGNTAEAERMRITGEGNVGINTTDPTEKLDNSGVTRLRSLPANGTANAIYTMPDGTASTAQDQTFTATRTVVADANGVLGYVTGLPTTGGGGTPPAGAINVGETVSQIYSIPASTTNTNTFNLNTYVTTNGLPALPVLDGLRIDLQGVSGTYYDPRIYNVAANTQLISYQSFATQVNENETSLNNSVATGGYLQVDSNNIVFWTTSAAEVETTNVQVQIDANTYRWYEFKWWCMEIGTGAAASKKIFLSITRKA